MSYTDQYIQKVESGKIKVGNKIQKAIDRHKRDIERSKSDDYPYKFDTKKSALATEFFKILPDTKTFRPYDEIPLYQLFIIEQLFAWVDKENGYRKYKKAYISMARKNSKSTLSAGIALYMLLFEKGNGKQIYTTALDREQAKYSFNQAVYQLTALRNTSKSVKNATKIINNEISNKKDFSFIKPLSGDTSNKDGTETFLGVLDEYATNRSNMMMTLLETSQGMLKEPLIIIISTASEKLNYPMHSEEYPFVTKLLDGEIEQENYLALCWEQDNVKELSNPQTWIKSNPIMELDSVRDDLIKKIKDKLDESRAKGNQSMIFTKHFNMWVQASKESYMSKEDWEAVKLDEPISIYNKEVYFGLDMSRSGDNTAISWLIPIDDEKFYMDSHSFIALKGAGGTIELKEKQDKTQYRLFEEKGFCSITKLESGLIDVDDMIDWLDEFVEKNNLHVKSIVYDPAYANQAISKMSEKYEMIQLPQRPTLLSQPTRSLLYAIQNKQLVHANNPLLTMAMYNAITVEKQDLFAIDRTSNRNKIDPVDAMINAWSEASYHEFDELDINEMIKNGDYSFGW